jgi:prepilin-type N-terminal cleavage/methylation domain-containing protein
MKPSPNRQGFSLIEILIVVAIASSVVLIVSNLSGNVSLLNGLVSQELQSKSDITQTMQIMTSEVRSAGPSASGAYPIDSAGTSSFVFYSDSNEDGKVERIRYFLASSTVWRGVIMPTGTPAAYPTATETMTDMIDNVVIPSSTTLLFRYYDASYTGTQPSMTSTADVTGIRLVGISFYTDIKPRQSPGPQYFSILINIRNLRSN